MSKSNVFMSFSDQVPSDAGPSSVDTPGAPVTTVEVDDRTGVQTETTTLNANVDLPNEVDVEVSRLILDDCLKCIDRNETSLTNLMRIYKKQTKATTVLTLTLEKVKRKEKRQQQKAETLKDALKVIADNLPTIAECVREKDDAEPCADQSGNPPPSPPPPQPSSAGQAQQPIDIIPLQQMIGEMRNKIDDLRQECKEMDALYNDLKARLDLAEQNERYENLDAALSKLASQVDEKRTEISDLLRALNQSLARIGNRLQKDYEIKQDPELNAAEVKHVLNNLLIDVKCLLREQDQTNAQIDRLREDINQLEIQIKTAEDMHETLVAETKKLLEIGNQEQTRGIDPAQYGEVTKFVEQVFDELLNTMNHQYEEKGKLQNRIRDLQRDDRQRQREFEREKTLKEDQCQRLREEIEALKRKNEQLREELERPPPKSQMASSSDPKVEERLRRIMDEQKVRDREREKEAEEKLRKARERNDAARQSLKDLTVQINDVDEQLERKRKELQDSQNAIDPEKEDGERRICEMDGEAAKRQGEIEALERELEDLLDKVDRNEELKLVLTETINYENRLTKKLRNLDQKLAQADADRGALANQLKKADDDCNGLRDQLTDEEGRRQQLENDLDEIQDEIDKASKALERERRRNLENERNRMDAMAMQQQFQFQQTTCTTITSGAGSFAGQNYSFSSSNPPKQSEQCTETGDTKELPSIIDDSSSSSSSTTSFG